MVSVPRNMHENGIFDLPNLKFDFFTSVVIWILFAFLVAWITIKLRFTAIILFMASTKIEKQSKSSFECFLSSLIWSFKTQMIIFGIFQLQQF